MGNIEKFDAMADRYDTEERAAVAKIIAGKIRERLCAAKGSMKTDTEERFALEDGTAIDYGCGTGLVGMEIAELFGKLIFMDASDNMTERVRRKLRAAGIANAEAICADLMSDNPPEARADFLILSQVLLHVKETEEFLSRSFNILNPGGRLFIIDFEKNEEISSPDVHNGFNKNELCESLKKIGFKESGAENFYSAENLFMNKAATLFILEALK